MLALQLHYLLPEIGGTLVRLRLNCVGLTNRHHVLLVPFYECGHRRLTLSIRVPKLTGRPGVYKKVALVFRQTQVGVGPLIDPGPFYYILNGVE